MDLEELLISEGVAAAQEQIRAVLDAALREQRHPAAALVEAGIVSEDVLADLLARACQSVIVDFDRGTVDADAPYLLSATLARELLVLPVSAAAGKLQVAFVNPLDDAALRAVESATGMPIQPLVGTLSGVRDAIEKTYAARSTRALGRSDGDMPTEDTRKVEVPSSLVEPPGTSPIHRIEQEATMEQRHEALLLALIERGVLTRADYTEALKRLLSGRR
jgi:hypothetical protein